VAHSALFTPQWPQLPYLRTHHGMQWVVLLHQANPGSTRGQKMKCEGSSRAPCTSLLSNAIVPTLAVPRIILEEPFGDCG
jgi:hypothetical protein